MLLLGAVETERHILVPHQTKGEGWKEKRNMGYSLGIQTHTPACVCNPGTVTPTSVKLYSHACSCAGVTDWLL